MLNITVDYDETAEKMKNARAIAQLISLSTLTECRAKPFGALPTWSKS